jgi:ABC-2 type transport system permease protein
MRVTPLRTHVYFETKVLCSYLMAVMSMIALCLAGSLLGVRLSASEWLVMSGLLLVGLVPFAALSVLLGHLLNVGSMGPALGGVISFLALIGGTFGPLATHGALYQATRLFPSYWLVQAGRTALGGHAWPAEGWVVVAAWTVALGTAAAVAYRRDTLRL